MRAVRKGVATAVFGIVGTVVSGLGSTADRDRVDNTSGTGSVSRPLAADVQNTNDSVKGTAEKNATFKASNRQQIDPDNPKGSLNATHANPRSPGNAAQRRWGDPRGVIADDTRRNGIKSRK